MRLIVADRRVLGFAALAVTILTPMFVLSADALRGKTEAPIALLRAVTLVAAVLFGYELFFTVQRVDTPRAPRIVRSALDEHIPFVPAWVWVYGALYYVFIAFPVGLFADSASFARYLAGGIAMLVIALPVYVLWPTQSLPAWRAHDDAGISIRFLKFIQTFDNGRACVPSLHMAFSVYAATFYPWRASLLLVPGLVGAACVLVKQHSILDLVPGAMLGLAVGLYVNTLF